jgi:hypothetical protein
MKKSKSDRPPQTSLLDAYICSKCCEVHIVGDSNYRGHICHQYTRGIGKVKPPGKPKIQEDNSNAKKTRKPKGGKKPKKAE